MDRRQRLLVLQRAGGHGGGPRQEPRPGVHLPLGGVRGTILGAPGPLRQGVGGGGGGAPCLQGEVHGAVDGQTHTHAALEAMPLGGRATVAGRTLLLLMIR